MLITTFEQSAVLSLICRPFDRKPVRQQLNSWGNPHFNMRWVIWPVCISLLADKRFLCVCYIRCGKCDLDHHQANSVPADELWPIVRSLRLSNKVQLEVCLQFTKLAKKDQMKTMIMFDFLELNTNFSSFFRSFTLGNAAHFGQKGCNLSMYQFFFWQTHSKLMICA